MANDYVAWQNQDFKAAWKYPEMPFPNRVAFVDPEHFRVDHPLNPHMLNASGRLNQVEAIEAKRQWQNLCQIYDELKFQVEVLEGQADCPDMVFCANQSLPFIRHDQEGALLLSHMASETRQQEVEPFARQMKCRVSDVQHLPFPRTDAYFFEGTGDALWVPGRKLLCGGYGFRTHASVYQHISKLCETSIALFELTNPRFYHLDTCLSLINEKTVLACKAGFTAQGWWQLNQLFQNVIEIPVKEADSPGFACNAHCPDGKHVILQKGNSWTETRLSQEGLIPVPVDTDEFIKSGGSVFCLKLMFF